MSASAMIAIWMKLGVLLWKDKILYKLGRGNRAPAKGSGGRQCMDYKSICSVRQIYLETSKDELGHKSPRTEVAYSRSDYDGQRWWTTWFTAREELKTQERTKEIDQFMESLFALPEMASLEAMRKMCRVYAAPTSERTEFNLFCDTDHFHVWRG